MGGLEMVTIKVPFFRRADFLIPFAIVTALIISVSVASAVDLERGLVAYYSFDDCSAKDLSGNGNDGIIYGAKCVDGKFGKALSFDGVNDYMEVPDSPSLDITDEITIEAWAYLKSTNAEALVAKNENVIVTGFWSNRTHLRLGSDTVYGSTVTTGQWYHYIATIKDIGSYRELKIYLNGVLDVSKETTEDFVINSNPWTIGQEWDNGNPSDFFNGIIDEVRIYNRALSEEEIRALYEQGVAPRPKLAIEMDIDTSLKQGEVRKGTIRVENIGNSDAKSVEVRLVSEGLGIDVEKSYAKIPSGEAREFLFEVSADEAGTFKLSAYAEYWDDKDNKYVETAEKSVHVEPVMLPTRETAKPAGFQAISTSLLIMVSYFLIKLREKKRN